jgi:hypothetical protein
MERMKAMERARAGKEHQDGMGVFTQISISHSKQNQQSSQPFFGTVTVYSKCSRIKIEISI